MGKRRHIALWLGWLAAFGLAVACLALVVQGIARDQRWGEPAIQVDFSRASGWQSEPFRVWGEHDFRLLLSSVNHDPEFVGRHLFADFEIRITGNSGRALFSRLYRGEAFDYRVPDGYADLELETLRIKGRPWQPGELQVRVREPDPAFATTRSEIKLWRDRPAVGMGGLINYAVMLPGALLTLVALVLAALLAARGQRWPLALTLVVLLALLALFVG